MDASSLAPPAPPAGAPCPATKKYLRTPGSPGPASLCPCDQFESADLQPWVDTQPGSTPCESCIVEPPPKSGLLLQRFFPPLAGAMAIRPAGEASSTTLYIDIPDSWWVGTPELEATTLELTYSSGDLPGRTVVSYSLNQSFSRGGPTSLRVDNLETPALLNPVLRSATLNFVIVRGGQKMSVSSPLFFSP